MRPQKLQAFTKIHTEVTLIMKQRNGLQFLRILNLNQLLKRNLPKMSHLNLKTLAINPLKQIPFQEKLNFDKTVLALCNKKLKTEHQLPMPGLILYSDLKKKLNNLLSRKKHQKDVQLLLTKAINLLMINKNGLT